MFNKPTLFVNSISVSEIGKENQGFYDSRKNIKGKVFHRIDDIVSLISYKRKVFVLINCLNSIYSGEVIDINYEIIIIKKDSLVKTIQTKNIKEIKILSKI